MPKQFIHVDLDDHGRVDSEFESVYKELDIKGLPYCQLYLDDTAVSASAIASGSYYQISGLTLGLNSTSNFITQTANDMTFTEKSKGTYYVSLNIGYKADKACTAHIACFVNGVKAANTSMEQGISATTAAYVANSSSSGFIQFQKDDVLTIKIGSSDTSNVGFTINHLQISVFRIADLL